MKTEDLRRHIRDMIIEMNAKKIVYDSWRNLTPKEIKFEYMVEYRHVKPIYGDVWPSDDDFIKAVKAGEVMTITPAIDRRIGYRSNTSSIDELEDLVSSYQYPRDIKRIVDGYKTGAQMPYPIVLRDEGGNLRIMGGNSRMDVAFIMGFNPKVVVVDIPNLKRKKR